MSKTAEQGGTDASLFPLPLSDFEHYMLADDRPSHPMVITLIAHVSGKLDRDRFCNAVVVALHNHPLLNCRVRRMSGRGWCWVSNSPAPPRVEWQEELSPPQPESLSESSLDLRHEAGLRLVVSVSKHRARVQFQIHHACCDGVGGVEFLGDVFAHYGLETSAPGDPTPRPGVVRVAQLAQRDRWSRTAPSLGSLRALGRILDAARRMMRRKPLLIGARRPAVVQSSSGNGPSRLASRMHTQVLSRELTKGLRKFASQQAVTVNDVCIGEMFHTIFDWNRDAEQPSIDKGIVILIPVSLRTPEHDQMPAANLVSYVFVTRTAAECDNGADLLSSIQRQTVESLRSGGQYAFLQCLRFVRRIPGLLQCLLGVKTCFSSVVLANVGDIRRLFSGEFPTQHGKWVAGNVTIDRIDGVAPLRPNTRAAMSIGSYAGELVLNLRTDATVFSEQDAAEFLARFALRLERIANSVARNAGETPAVEVSTPALVSCS